MLAIITAALLIASATAQDAFGNCGIPLRPQSQQPIDPVRHTGIWYEYLYRTPGVDDINAKDHYDFVGCYQDYGISKAAVNWTLAYYLVAPGQPCVGIQGIMNITSDGRKEAKAFTFGIEFSLELFIFYTDYDFMEMYYACQTPASGGPNNITGLKPTDICPNPSLWVRTRYEPSKLTAAQKAQAKSIADAHLAQYCYSVDKIVGGAPLMTPTAVDLTKNPVFCAEAVNPGLAALRATIANAPACAEAPPTPVPTVATSSAAPVTVATSAATVAPTTAAPATTAAPTLAPTTAYVSTAAPATTAAPTVAPTTAASTAAPATPAAPTAAPTTAAYAGYSG